MTDRLQLDPDISSAYIDAEGRRVINADTVTALRERDRLADANDTLALTLAEAIGTLAADGDGCSRGWIPAVTVDRWRRALHEAEEARRG